MENWPTGVDDSNRDLTSTLHNQQPINLRQIAAYDFHVLWSPQPYCLLLGDGADRRQWVAVVPRKSNDEVSLFVRKINP